MVNFKNVYKKDIKSDTKRSLKYIDGPTPMRYYRSAEKRQNAAEQFRAENQGPAETFLQRDHNTRDATELNLAYPRLDETLHKKHSLTKITTLKAQKLNANFDRKCEACAQLAVYRDLKKKKPRPKCRCKPRVPRMPKPRTALPGVTFSRRYNNLIGVHKPKARKNRNYDLSKIWINKGCQCSHSFVRVIPKTSKCCSTGNTRTSEASTEYESRFNLKKNRLHTDDQNNSDDNQQQRKKKHPSISSYNSFGSIDHEPMDM